MHNKVERPSVSRNYLTFGVDRDAPITVKVPVVQVDEQAQNQAILGVAELLSRRSQIRISVEAWCKWNGKWRYKRLRARHVTISCPNPEQAELVIEVLTTFLQQLDGLLLAPTPKECTLSSQAEPNDQFTRQPRYWLR